jgi:VanZ family protein
MKKYLAFLPAALDYALVFYLSSKALRVGLPIPSSDKWAHVFEFALLGFLLSFGFFKTLKTSLRIKVLLTLAIGILLGILDEIHQYFVPSRYSDILDGLADAAGIGLGILVYCYFDQKKKKASQERGRV